MKQPDLGRKIAELRKEMGFTQEELVEKCNLSVRTLQRIESGDVTPRSYTVKVIFTALGYNIHEKPQGIASLIGKTMADANSWTGKFYYYVSDLFNLKTNTMKKVTILSVSIAAIILSLFILAAESKAQASVKARTAIEENDRNLVRWINTGKLDSVMTLYKEDACLLPDYCGKDNLREVIGFVMQGGYEMLEYQILSLNVCHDLAIEKYYCVFQYQGETVKQKGLTEWHRIDGKWLIANDIYSNESR